MQEYDMPIMYILYFFLYIYDQGQFLAGLLLECVKLCAYLFQVSNKQIWRPRDQYDGQSTSS